MNSPSVLEGIVGEHDDQHCLKKPSPLFRTVNQKLGFYGCTIIFTVILIMKQDNTVVDSKMLVCVCEEVMSTKKTCSCFLNNLRCQRPTFWHPFWYVSRRRSACRAGEAVHPEVAAVLRPLWFRLGPAERPEMEGGETGGAERNGGVHHPQQERHHRAYLSRGGSHGQYLGRLSWIWLDLNVSLTFPLYIVILMLS